MSRQLLELENVLEELVSEHERLLQHMAAQQVAMRAMDALAIDTTARMQDTVRRRILTLEVHRRTLVNQLGAELKLPPNPTMVQIAAAVGSAGQRLLPLRDKLKAIIARVATQATIGGRLAGAVLGHLNTAVRLLAGAVQQAGTYTRRGVPQMSRRIGVIEAVG